MYLYFWLKPGTEEKFRSLQTESKIGKKFKPEAHLQTGQLHFYADGEITVVRDVARALPADVLEKVTFSDTIARGFVPDGIYRQENSEMIVRTKRRFHDSSRQGGYPCVVQEVAQEVIVSAPNFDALWSLYSRVRQGGLSPDELWGNEPIFEPPHEAGFESS